MAGRSSGKLEVTLPSDTEILLSRVFDAPRHLVFEVFTNPEYVRQWYGCPIPGSTMPVCEIDLRVGGKYRYVTRTADGQEFGFNGVYQEIVVPERVVSTEIFEPFPDSPSLNTMTLVERGGKTYFQTLVKHSSKQARDGHIQSGMEQGANIALDRAEELAQAMVSPASLRRPTGAARP